MSLWVGRMRAVRREGNLAALLLRGEEVQRVAERWSLMQRGGGAAGWEADRQLQEQPSRGEERGTSRGYIQYWEHTQCSWTRCMFLPPVVLSSYAHPSHARARDRIPRPAAGASEQCSPHRSVLSGKLVPICLQLGRRSKDAGDDGALLRQSALQRRMGALRSGLFRCSRRRTAKGRAQAGSARLGQRLSCVLLLAKAPGLYGLRFKVCPLS